MVRRLGAGPNLASSWEKSGAGMAPAIPAPVDRTRLPPANGVGRCETDADLGCGRFRPGPQGIRVTALGLAPPTECGRGSNVVPIVSSADRAAIQRFEAAARIGTTVTISQAAPTQVNYNPCCYHNYGRDSSCHSGQ